MTVTQEIEQHFDRRSSSVSAPRYSPDGTWAHERALPGSERYREIEKEIRRVTEAELSLLRVMLSSGYLKAFKLTGPQVDDSEQPVTPEIPVLREQILMLLRRTGEIQYVVQKSLSCFQQALCLLRDPSRPPARFDLEKMDNQFLYLQGFVEEVCQERRRELEKVRTALENPEWDFRTVEGISNETGLPVSTIEEVLKENPGLFRKSHATDRAGRALFTTASRPIRWRERLAVWQHALSGDATPS